MRQTWDQFCVVLDHSGANKDEKTLNCSFFFSLDFDTLKESAPLQPKYNASLRIILIEAGA